MMLPTPRGRRVSAVVGTRHLYEYPRDSRTAALAVCWVAALVFTLTGCDEGSSTSTSVPDGFDYSGVCNPPCSPGFTCSDERVCIPDPDTPEPGDTGIGDPMDSSVPVDGSDPTDRDADAPTDLGAVADATDMMTTESGDMGVQPDTQSGDACVGEGCESACEDDCALDESVCADEGRVVLNCGQFDPDPCLDWGDRQVCGAQQICVDGECTAQSSCDDVAECVAEERRCGPEGVQRCSEVDGCLMWGPADPCAEGFQCQNGVCVDQSVDECPMIGATACLGELLIECGQFDDDAALDWSGGERCPDGQSCSGGRCAERAACADECQVDQRRCRGLGVEGCVDADGDDCLEFGGRQACENGESCSYGDCAADCQDECAVGETTCQFGALVICGEFDGDACTDWSLAVACPGDQLCVDLRCQDPANIQPGPQPNPINIITPLAQARVTGTQTVTVEVPRHGHIQDTRIEINGEALLRQDHGGLLSARWDTTTGPDGPVTITVRVDGLAQDEWVQTREVIVDNTAPAIVIEAPQANSRHHSPFDFTVRPEDQSGIADVRFLIDGEEFAWTDEPPWTAPIDPAQFQPWGPKTLEVVVHDTVGLMARQSMNVHFEPAQIDLALVSPAMGSPMARPFDFEVQALDETPIDSVSFEVDGQAVGVPVRAAPFRVTIDPANYAGVEHRLEAVARHASGAIGRYTLNVTWDQDAPQAHLLRPAADATITLAQETVTFAFDVVDLDPQVRIRAFIDDEEVAAVEGPPYQLDLATDRVMGETHDELIELRFVMSDYLGNTHTTRTPMVFSRADWSMRLPNGETPMIHALSTLDGALIGAFDRLQNRGRVYRVGAAGERLSFDVSMPGGHPVQLIEFPAQLDVGVIVERDGQHHSYVHIAQGAVAWESAVGHVTDVHPGPPGSVYLIATRPDEAFENQGRLFRFDFINGVQLWDFDPRSPFGGGRNESVDWMALADNGTVLVRTVAENRTDHQYYGFNQAGEELWRYEVQGQVAQSALRGDSLIVARHLVDPFDPHCVLPGDPLCLRRAVEVVSIDINDGQRRWARDINPNFEPTQLGFLADGDPFLIGQRVADFGVSIDVFNDATGDLVSDQNDLLGLIPGEAIPTPGGELAVAMSNVWPPNGEDESWGGIYRLNAVGQDVGGYRTIDEVVGDIDGYDGTIAAALSPIGGGSDAVLMLDAAGESVWRTEMEPGFAINRVHMHTPLSTDARVEETATGRGVILPFDADGTIDWRIDRAGASVSSYAATADELYVTISDDEGLELLRIPRD